MVGDLYNSIDGHYVRVYDAHLHHVVKTISAGFTHNDNVVTAVINGVGIKFTVKDLLPGYYVSTTWNNQIIEMTYPKSNNPVQCICEVASMALGLPVTNESTYQLLMRMDLERHI